MIEQIKNFLFGNGSNEQDFCDRNYPCCYNKRDKDNQEDNVTFSDEIIPEDILDQIDQYNRDYQIGQPKSQLQIEKEIYYGQ